jgi:hypothetical protein
MVTPLLESSFSMREKVRMRVNGGGVRVDSYFGVATINDERLGCH